MGDKTGFPNTPLTYITKNHCEAENTEKSMWWGRKHRKNHCGEAEITPKYNCGEAENAKKNKHCSEAETKISGASPPDLLK